MQGQPHVWALCGPGTPTGDASYCLFVRKTSTAPPAASEAPDAGLLMAPEASPKRGGVLRWGGLANSTLYDLHQTRDAIRDACDPRLRNNKALI